MSELFDIHKKYNSVKTYDKYPYAHTFLNDVYPMYFDRKRKTATRILEVGIYKGGALLAMQEYFPKAKIVGVDIVDLAKERVASEPRIKFIQGSQYDADFLRKVCEEHGPFDFIIEDGCHKVDAQIATFENTFEYVKPGGVYFVEDVIREWRGYRILDYFKNQVTPDRFANDYNPNRIAALAFYYGLIAVTRGRV